LAGKKADYSHVQSKVRQYIYGDRKTELVSATDYDNDIYGKSFVLSPGRKSLSMSNLVQELDSKQGSRRTSIKSYLSSKNLDDLQIHLRSRSSTFSKSRESVIVNEKVARLLPTHHSTDDENDEATEVADRSVQDQEALFEVQELLELAMNERQGKMEAKQVLAQLQANYDDLQKKFAAAEITIDNLRFGTSERIDGNILTVDSAFTEDNDSFHPSSSFQSCQVPNPPLSSNSGHPPPSLSSYYHILTDIQEQLYGLEIMSSNASSYSSLEKRETMEKLKASYSVIQNNCRIVSDFVNCYLFFSWKVMYLET